MVALPTFGLQVKTPVVQRQNVPPHPPIWSQLSWQIGNSGQNPLFCWHACIHCCHAASVPGSGDIGSEPQQEQGNPLSARAAPGVASAASARHTPQATLASHDATFVNFFIITPS